MFTSWVDDDKRTHKKVDKKAVKGWAKQILLGLDYLHSHSPPIIHRDVKCDNIFINGNHGEVKIGDLGLATIMEQASLHSVLGTPEFMAPEIYDEDYNELVDIYSFCMCMLEMITNECPYSECTNCPQIYKKVVNRIMPAALAKVKDLETKQFIERCLGPIVERLPAKELLKDPFLQLTDCNAAGVLALPKKESNTEQCVVAGNSSITVVAGRSHRMPTLEVQRLRRGSEFKLKGKKEDEMDIDFVFYLQSETALSVADEMVEQLHIADQSVVFVAELIDVLIDVLIMSLVPNWNPCVLIDQLVVTHQYAASISNHHPCFDSIRAVTDTPGINKLEHIPTHADCGGARNKAAKEDRDIGTFPEKNYTDSCTNSCVCADSGSIVHNGCFQDVSADGVRLELEMIELAKNLLVLYV
ncbi:hypothetical protein MKX01_040818 [Papaver californicum]|nr:hypothetical protein MKX01_040818 [Papaver californicum]